MSPGDRPTSSENISSPSFLPFSSESQLLSPVVSSTQLYPKKYQLQKLVVRILSGSFTWLTLVILVLSGLTASLTSQLRSMLGSDYGVLFGTFASVGLVLLVVRFPFLWYSGRTIERRFGLLRQSPGGWFKDIGKGILVSSLIGGAVVAALYWSITTFQGAWWFPLGVVLFAMHMLLAVIGPKALLPFFYTLTPLEDSAIRERIQRVCDRAGIRAEGFFVIGLGEKTKKANAALTGLGPAKRIVVSDTLLQNLRNDEIEAVVAHEVGHLKLRHVLLNIMMGALSSLLSLYLASLLYDHIAGFAGTSRADIAFLPMLGAVLSVISFVLGPVSLWLSRWEEFAADRYAVLAHDSAGPLSCALEKLARLNLADPDPHPFIEYLTFSHPSLNRRLARLTSVA